jgi:hypothetical protein
MQQLPSSRLILASGDLDNLATSKQAFCPQSAMISHMDNQTGFPTISLTSFIDFLEEIVELTHCMLRLRQWNQVYIRRDGVYADINLCIPGKSS